MFCNVAMQGFASLLDSTNRQFEHAFNVNRFGGHIPFQFTEAPGEGVNPQPLLLFLAHSQPTEPEFQSRYRFRGIRGGRQGSSTLKSNLLGISSGRTNGEHETIRDAVIVARRQRSRPILCCLRVSR